MKTVLPFRELRERKEQAVFYHGDEISITQEVRPLPPHWNSSQTRDGVEVPMTEMEFFVLRFPKEWRKNIESGAFGSGVKIWNKLDSEWELLVPTYGYSSIVFNALARSGFFKYTDKTMPLPKEGLYLPYYQTPIRFFHFVCNFFTLLLSIPQASWFAYQDRKERKQMEAKREDS